MSHSIGKKKTLEDIIRTDGRYPPEAFDFLLDEGLPRAVREAYDGGSEQAGGSSRAPAPHAEAGKPVHGRQLCLALRDEAIDKWGMLASVVLAKWNIRSTLDFGNMVYLLIEHNVMQKTAEDSIEDFRDVYDFAETFRFEPDLHLKE